MNRTGSVPGQEFLSGARDTFPLILGALPFGLIYGAVAATSGLSMTAAMAMSALVFAGSAQFIAVGLVSAHTPVAIIVLTTFIVNLRHMLYSATLLPYLKSLPQKWRIPLAFWLTDETFAVTVHRFQKEDPSSCKNSEKWDFFPLRRMVRILTGKYFVLKYHQAPLPVICRMIFRA